eukprot:364723-Chlamydomonas_euryale.AAC.9
MGRERGAACGERCRRHTGSVERKFGCAGLTRTSTSTPIGSCTVTAHTPGATTRSSTLSPALSSPVCNRLLASDSRCAAPPPKYGTSKRHAAVARLCGWPPAAAWCVPGCPAATDDCGCRGGAWAMSACSHAPATLDSTLVDDVA